MKIDYYPWNVQALVDWLSAEGALYTNPGEFAAALGISRVTLRRWKGSHLPDITLEEIYSLARYRRCSLEATIQWLGITPMHLDLLVK
jgi:hypothetical protein